jgi:hypothetical protein
MYADFKSITKASFTFYSSVLRSVYTAFLHDAKQFNAAVKVFAFLISRKYFLNLAQPIEARPQPAAK